MDTLAHKLDLMILKH